MLKSLFKNIQLVRCTQRNFFCPPKTSAPREDRQNFNESETRFNYARKVLMVEPTNFFLNEESFEDNKLMKKTQMDHQELTTRAIDEFKRFKDTIQQNDIDVEVYKQLSPDLPDSIFVNNWVSTYKNEDIPKGLLFFYPMRVPSREREKNPQIIKKLSQQYGEFIDIIRNSPDQALEGNGSLVFDYENRKIFVKLSARADADLLWDFAQKLNDHSKDKFRVVIWHQDDPNSDPINHTNVVMSCLRNHIVLCSQSIINQKEKEKVLREITNSYLNKKTKELIDISLEEMKNHCGNILMLENKKGEDCVVMSDRAKAGFKPDTLQKLEKNYKIISSDIHTIEEVGGGSARSMIAELF